MAKSRSICSLRGLTGGGGASSIAVVLGPRRVGDAVQRTFDVRRADLAVEQTPSHDGGHCYSEKNQSQTDHEEAIAPARRRWHTLSSGSRSHVSCGRFASTQGPCRIDSTDEPMTTQWADLLEASLRPISSAATLRRRCGDRTIYSKGSAKR
jgi:hypothetical protein